MRKLLTALSFSFILQGCGTPLLFFSQQIENESKITDVDPFVGTWSVRNASLGLVIPETQELAQITITVVGENKLVFDGPKTLSSGITSPLMTPYQVHWEDTNCTMLQDSSIVCLVLVSYDARRFIATERIPSAYIFTGENLRWRAYLPFVLKSAAQGQLLMFQPRPEHFQRVIESETLSGTIFVPAIRPVLEQLQTTHLYVDVNGQIAKNAIDSALALQRFDSSVISQPMLLAINRSKQLLPSELAKFEGEWGFIKELSEDVDHVFAMLDDNDEEAFEKAENFSFLARKAKSLAEQYPVYEVPLTYLSHLLFEQNELLRGKIWENERISSIEVFDRINDFIGGPPETIFSDYSTWIKKLEDAPIIRSDFQSEDTTSIKGMPNNQNTGHSRARHASALMYWTEHIFCARLASFEESALSKVLQEPHLPSCESDILSDRRRNE